MAPTTKTNQKRRHRFGALRYQPRGRGGVSIAINLAPMIDVTFLLLIFFLVTTTFERAEGLLASRMPDQGEGPQVALPLDPIVVRLTSAGPDGRDVTIRIDNVASATIESFGALKDALLALHDEPGFDRDTPVVIVAGDDVLWDHVVGCWNAALRARCRHVAFGEP